MTLHQLLLVFNGHRFQTLAAVCEAGQYGTTQVELAKSLNTSVDAVKLHIDTLMELGLVEAQLRRNQRTCYAKPGAIEMLVVDVEFEVNKLLKACNAKTKGTEL
jgi:predicted transcriptional regulator